jgi:hypothetical protein
VFDRKIKLILVVLNSLTHLRKFLLVVLQIGKWEIGKAKDLSAPLRIYRFLYDELFEAKL